MIRKRKRKYVSEFNSSYDELVGGHLSFFRALLLYLIVKASFRTKNVRLEICPDPFKRWWYVLKWDWRE